MTPEEIKLQEESTKLLMDIRSKYEDMQKNRIAKVDYDTFVGNMQKKLDEIDVELAKLKSPPMVAGDKVDTKQLRAAFCKAIKTYEPRDIAAYVDMLPPELKVLTIADTTHAGVLAYPEYANQIIKNITLYSPLRQLATVVQTDAYVYEFPVQTAIATAVAVAESAEKTETTGLTYANIEIKLFEMYQLFKATQKLLRNSAFNIDTEIADASGRAMGVLESTWFYSGNGTAAAEGITINTTVLADARDVITNDTLAFDDFIGTFYQLAEPYARNGAWVMNRSTLGVCVGLKSATTNTYLLQPNLQAGQPTTILGAPVYTWSNFPAITSTALGTTPGDGGIVLAFGDFRAGYRIVDQQAITIQRLVEKYIEFGFIGFNCNKFVGGGVVLPEAIQLLKNKTGA